MDLKQGFKQTDFGVIPEDWLIDSLGNLGQFNKGSGVKKDESQSGDLACIRYGELYTKHHNIINQCYSFISPEVSKSAKKIKSGDILFAGSGETKEEIGKCAAFIKEYDAFAGGDIIIFTPKNCSSIFLGYLLNSITIVKQKASKGQGDAVVHISSKELSKIIIPYPPIKEQNVIAQALLDTDTYITILEKLVEKKNQILQGAVQELLKPKGGWEIKKIGELGKCLRGVNYNPERDLFSFDNNNSIRLLRSNNIQNSKIDFNGLQFVDKMRVNKHQIVQKDDIIICMANGSKQLVGKAARFPKKDNFDYTFGAFMGCFRTDSTVADSSFVFYNFLTASYRNYIDVLLSGSSINNLNPKNIESIEIYLPKIEIQKQISDTLTSFQLEIDIINAKLEKVKSIKQGMIQNLLTGKIRLL